MFCGWSQPTEAREPAISIDARTLPAAIAELAREARVSIGAEGRLPKLPTPPVHGAAGVADALAVLLRGTGLVARQVGATAWRIERAPAPPPLAQKPLTQQLPTPEATAEPIVVSAGKRSVELARAPYDVSVMRFSADRDPQAGDGSAFVAARADGVTVGGAGPGRNRMFLRGVADSPFNGPSQSTVAVVLDEARLTFSAPDPDIRLVDVARVEVLKGPQGTLYGTGALGGIYRIVTHRPDTGGDDLAITIGSEAVAHGGLGANGSAMANIVLEPDTAALRLVAYGAREPGWVDSETRRNGNAGSALGLRAAVGLDAGDWRADATAFGQWLNSRDSAYVYHPGVRSRPAQIAEPHDNDLRHLALRIERKGSLGVLISSGITWHEVADRYDATLGADGLGLASPQVLNDARTYRTWDSEVRVTGSLGPIDWLAGISNVDARQNSDRVLASSAGTYLALTADRRSSTDSAVFGEAAVPLPAQFKLALGARLFRSHFDEVQRVPAPATRDLTKVGLTPSVTISWQPWPGRIAWLRYGSAFREGGSALQPDGSLASLAGDELGTIEAGWRESIKGGTLTLAAWRSRWENVQSDTFLASGRLGTVNAGNAAVAGLEVGWAGALADHWTAELGAAWTSARLVRSSLSFDLDDRHLPLIPDLTARARIAHGWTFRGWDASLAAGARYTGGARLSFDPQLDYAFGKSVLVDAELRLARGPVALRIATLNVTGSNADTMPLGNPFRLALGRQYSPSRPPSVTLSLTYTR